MHRLLNTGATDPCSKNTSRMVPLTGAVISNVVLSVSISAITSPAVTRSPLCFRHSPTMHSSTVLPTLGTSTGVIYCKFSISFQPTSQNWESVRCVGPNPTNSSAVIPSGS